MAKVISYKGQKYVRVDDDGNQYVRVDAGENQKAIKLSVVSANIGNKLKSLDKSLKEAANKSYENCEKEIENIRYCIDFIVKQADVLKSNKL